MAPTATKTTTRSRATKPTGGATRAPSKKSQQDEATRLKTEALETLTTAVVMLDRDLNITYLNRAAQEFMFDHEAAFGEASPQFSADQLVGESVDVLIPDLRHQRPLTDPASLPYCADLNVGDHIVALSASGHLDGEGEFLGCTIELSDITEAIDRDTQVEAVNRSLARVEFTLDGTILTANQNFFDAMGYTEDQIVGQHHRVLVDPAYAASPEYANFWDQLGRGQLDEGEYRRYKKSGDLIWLKASYNLAFDRDGNPTKVIKLASDITAEKQSLAEAKFKSEALGTVRTAIMMVDRDLCINYMNDAAYKLMKGAEHAFRTVWPTFNADTLIGECIDQFHTNPAHQRRLLDDPANLPFSADIEVAGLSFGLNVTAQINDDGEYVGSALEWEDLTKLLDVTAKIEAIDRTQAMIEFDMNGIVLGANQNFYDRMGYTEAELVGKHHRIFVDPTEAASPAYNMFWESLGRGQYDEGEYRRFTKSGEEIWLQASYNPVVDRKGDPVKVVKVARDITSEVQSRQQIQSLVETSSSVMESVARGDLTRSVTGAYDGNLGLLQDAINASVENLSGLVTNIRESAVSMSSSAKEVATANQDLSRRTEAQASSLEETASSMEEMTATVQQNADNSRKASQLAVSAREQAQDGGTVVDQAVEAMQAISESSKKIADIIGVIDEIAFQTNLLALNAAVEAARAGDQGRGFAVVASEVRNLAQRSAGAAKEIKTLIQDSLEKVDDGSNLVNQSGTQLGEIVSSVKKVSDIIGEIAAASEEQSAGITQVNQAVTQMDQGTQQNAAMVEQASAASTSVQEQSHALLELTQQFQVSGMSSGNSPSGSVRPSTPPPAASPAPAVAEPVQQVAPVENYSSGDDDAWAEF